METKQLQLQPRLQLLADLVRDGARLADIGTDHGYLPIWLIQHGRITTAIAGDVGELPLEHARRTVREQEVEGVDLRLCDGLRGIAPEEADTIVIAGMGGDTIVHILEAAPWTKEGRHTLLLQPMTKIEWLRGWLAENGYRFTRERLVWDKDFLYPVMEVVGGEQQPLSEVEQYTGTLLEGDPLYGEYLQHQLDRLARAIAGMRRSTKPESLAKAEELEALRRAIEAKKEELA